MPVLIMTSSVMLVHVRTYRTDQLTPAPARPTPGERGAHTDDLKRDRRPVQGVHRWPPQDQGP